MMEIILIVFGILIGAFAVYAKLSPKVEATQKYDLETAEINEKLRADVMKLSNEQASLTAKREEILASIDTLQRQAKESAKTLYEESYKLANEKMEQAAETISNKYKEMEKKAEQEYLNSLADYTKSFSVKLDLKNRELIEIEERLSDLSAKVDAAVEASKRAEELRVKQDFYRLNLSDADIEEISRLREVTPYLRNSEPLNKVIWKVYYEKPTTDLIGRVVGTGTHTGIYKITNIKSQKCYVGQAANIADRWKQHIKRGIGAETPTRNKLYPAMLEEGIENFTFEIVEEVDRSLLNDREDYWQNYFHAKDFGYSIK